MSRSYSACSPCSCCDGELDDLGVQNDDGESLWHCPADACAMYLVDITLEQASKLFDHNLALENARYREKVKRVAAEDALKEVSA